MRSSARDTPARSCARSVLCRPAFPLVPALRSTNSAAAGAALFAGFSRRMPPAFVRIATISGSDFSCPCIIGYGSSPSRRGPDNPRAARSDMRSPRFRPVPFRRDGVFDHDGVSAPCVAAPPILPSAQGDGLGLRHFQTFAAQYPTPHNCCVRFVAAVAGGPRNTRYRAGASPYPGRTLTGWTRSAYPDAPPHSRRSLFSRWNEGCSAGRKLFAEIKELGYTGSYSNLAHYLARWRDKAGSAQPEVLPLPRQELPIDPATGRAVSPLIAAMLCIKPRSLLTVRQAGCVEALKAASTDFVVMRGLAMRLRGLLR